MNAEFRISPRQVPKKQPRRKILNMAFICLRARALTPARMVHAQYPANRRHRRGYKSTRKTHLSAYGLLAFLCAFCWAVPARAEDFLRPAMDQSLVNTLSSLEILADEQGNWFVMRLFRVTEGRECEQGYEGRPARAAAFTS